MQSKQHPNVHDLERPGWFFSDGKGGLWHFLWREEEWAVGREGGAAIKTCEHGQGRIIKTQSWAFGVCGSAV